MQRIMLWGTGQVAEEVLTKCLTLDSYDILGCIDNDREKAGTDFYGYKVYVPDILNAVVPEKIVVLAEDFEIIQEQIGRQYPQFANVVEDKFYFYKQSILQRYADTDDLEIKTVIDHVEENGLSAFNYKFTEKYKDIAIKVIFDEGKDLFYTIHNGKKMYFSRSYDSEQKAEEYYRYLLMEQDEESPHRYLTENFLVEEGDIVVDAGAAEGNFSLEIIDKVKKLYLIETDDAWIEALKVTFAGYMDKVIIVKAFVSDYDEGRFACLDTLIQEPVNLIKLDIEGNEWDALRGAKGLIEKSPKLKIVACAYHQDADQVLIENIMDEYRMSHEVSNGYMWFPWSFRQTYVSTKLHRGLIRGTKE